MCNSIAQGAGVREITIVTDHDGILNAVEIHTLNRVRQCNDALNDMKEDSRDRMDDKPIRANT